MKVKRSNPANFGGFSARTDDLRIFNEYRLSFLLCKTYNKNIKCYVYLFDFPIDKSIKMRYNIGVTKKRRRFGIRVFCISAPFFRILFKSQAVEKAPDARKHYCN